MKFTRLIGVVLALAGASAVIGGCAPGYRDPKLMKLQWNADREEMRRMFFGLDRADKKYNPTVAAPQVYQPQYIQSEPRQPDYSTPTGAMDGTRSRFNPITKRWEGDFNNWDTGAAEKVQREQQEQQLQMQRDQFNRWHYPPRK